MNLVLSEKVSKLFRDLVLFQHAEIARIETKSKPLGAKMVVYAVRESVVIRPLRGAAPGISKGCPLRYAFADFSRKRKVSARVGGMSPQKETSFL